jgi:putative FmdB family regulatory protein
MPIFEYACGDCGHVQEALILTPAQHHGMQCQRCGSNRMAKLMSAHSAAPVRYGREKGHTCCGREERCAAPPCSSGGGCHKGT